MAMKNKKASDAKINKKLLYGIAYFTLSFLVAVVFNSGEEDRSVLVIAILFFSLFLPLELLCYYQLRKFLNKKGVKSSYQSGGGDNVDSFMEEISNNHGPLTTNIFLNKKNKFLGYALNLFGDLFINIFVVLYTVVVFAISALFVWGALKLFS